MDALLSQSQAVFAAKARSFSFAALWLPREVRERAALLYAFCRLVDDLADESGSPQQALDGLDAVEAELRGEAPARPLVAAVREILPDPGPALDLLAGARSDQGEVRVEDDAQLLRYCYAVAGTVGLMMCGVLGVRDRAAWPHAVDLGIAMQLTNICRDVAEDAGLGRVYLPAARLRAAGEDPGRLLAGEADPARVARVVADLLALADRYYASGEAGLGAIRPGARFAILVAARVYHGIGDRLRARGCDALAGRVAVPLWRKILYIPEAMLAGVRLALRPARPHDSGLHFALTNLRFG